MAQPRRYNLVNMVPCRITTEHYIIKVTNSAEYECDGNGRCCTLILDLPGVRQSIQCPYTAGKDGHVYGFDLIQILFSALHSLGLVQTRRNRLVLCLVSFVLDFAINRHCCPLDGPVLVPVAYIRVEAREDSVLARSVRERGCLWAKRAIVESVLALPGVRADELENDASCVICVEELIKNDHDHDNDRIARMPCRHVFHRDCIAGWLKNSHVCPLCRFEMPAELISKP